jgi:capsular exopolysaccharide synthesis family protein
MLDGRTGGRPGERTVLPVLPGGREERKRRTLLTRMPESAFAESYRKLRTSFLLSQVPDPPRVAVVTSAMPREGKTSVAINLSIALAQRGASVLLIDADLRRPRVHTVLSLDNTYGLSTMLGDHVPLQPLRVPSVPNLWVLPCGPPPANPADALSSPRMEALIREFRETYDHVVLDSPPLAHFTDAVVMSHFADGALLVTAAGSTSRETLARAFRTLSDARCTVLGVVLNRVNFSSEPYYYSAYAYRYYHYYYGKGGSGSRKTST